MTEAVAVFGIALAVLGGGVIFVSEGSRGLVAGLAAVAAGLGLALGGDLLPAPGLVVALAGAGSALIRLRGHDSGWGLMPEGSTARIVLWSVSSALSLYVATTVLTGPRAEIRSAALAVVVVSGARLLGTSSAVAALVALSALALGIGTMGTALSASLLPAAAGAAVALVAALVPEREFARGT